MDSSDLGQKLAAADRLFKSLPTDYYQTDRTFVVCQSQPWKIAGQNRCIPHSTFTFIHLFDYESNPLAMSRLTN